MPTHSPTAIGCAALVLVLAAGCASPSLRLPRWAGGSERLSEEALRNESAGITSQRMVLEEQLAFLRRQALPLVGDLDPERLNSICAAVAKWLSRAGEPEKALVLEALQIRVTATVDQTRISGVLPTELPSFLEDEPTSEFSSLTEHTGVPFDRAFRFTK